VAAESGPGMVAAESVPESCVVVPESTGGGAPVPGRYALQSGAWVANVNPKVQMFPAFGSQYGSSDPQSSFVAHAPPAAARGWQTDPMHRCSLTHGGATPHAAPAAADG
jgi:hypothetical protein